MRYIRTVIHGKSSDVELVDDQIFHRDLCLVCLPPVEVGMDNTGTITVEHIVFVSPLALPGNGTCIRIQQDFGLIEAESLFFIIRTIQTIGVFKFFNIQSKNDHRIAETDLIILRKRNDSIRFFCFPVE